MGKGYNTEVVGGTKAKSRSGPERCINNKEPSNEILQLIPTEELLLARTIVSEKDRYSNAQIKPIPYVSSGGSSLSHIGWTDEWAVV